MATKELKMVWVICCECEGEGKVSNPAFSDGFTQSEWADMDFDEQRSIMSGRYDVQCPTCKGRGSVKMIDMDQFTPLRRARMERIAAFHADVRASLHAEEEAERRYGC